MTVTPFLGSTRMARQVLAEVKELVEPAHRSAIDRLPDLMRQVAGYHVGWWDAYCRPSISSGKSVRPALVLAAAAAVGGDLTTTVPEAVAVELVHDFSLLHDDVMDGDLIRRHRPTAWSAFGVGAAILTGDGILSLAVDLLAERPRLRVLTGARLELSAGQCADMTFASRASVSIEECVAMSVGKTGALLACACELGALVGGGDERQCRLLAKFGRHLGLSFQLVDDLLGIWGDPAVTGKSAHSDLANRKKSLPVVAATTSGTSARDLLNRLYPREPDGDHGTLARLAELIEDAGGRRWAQAEADRRLSAALDYLAQVGPKETTDLRTLAHVVTGRDR